MGLCPLKMLMAEQTRKAFGGACVADCPWYVSGRVKGCAVRVIATALVKKSRK